MFFTRRMNILDKKSEFLSEIFSVITTAMITLSFFFRFLIFYKWVKFEPLDFVERNFSWILSNVVLRGVESLEMRRLQINCFVGIINYCVEKFKFAYSRKLQCLIDLFYMLTRYCFKEHKRCWKVWSILQPPFFRISW